MDLGFADATVAVTGGTAGMGRASAACFAADGARGQDLGGGDGPAEQVAFESRANGLDLGQLRHRRRRPSRAAAARNHAARRWPIWPTGQQSARNRATLGRGI